MATAARKVAAFRKRLADRTANWAIDISARRRIRLDLTQEQQRALRRATRRAIPSLTLIFYTGRIDPSGQVLCSLDIRAATRAAKARARKPARRTAR